MLVAQALAHDATLDASGLQRLWYNSRGLPFLFDRFQIWYVHPLSFQWLRSTLPHSGEGNTGGGRHEVRLQLSLSDLKGEGCCLLSSFRRDEGAIALRMLFVSIFDATRGCCPSYAFLLFDAMDSSYSSLCFRHKFPLRYTRNI